jgi:hypothetical protein
MVHYWWCYLNDLEDSAAQRFISNLLELWNSTDTADRQKLQKSTATAADTGYTDEGTEGVTFCEQAWQQKRIRFD